MKVYEVWSEGYAATGEHGTAQLMGTFSAETFDEAVENMLKYREATDWPNIRKWYDLKTTTNGEKYHAIWACRLYDNEQDARKSFG